MKKLAFIGAFAALTLVPAADATVLKTNWIERQTYATGNGFMRVYVRKIELTRTTWKAWVGLTNASAARVTLVAKPLPASVNSPSIVYWAGPGIWWTASIAGGSWWPGAHLQVTRTTKARVAPAIPKIIAPHKSWFGTFSGSLAKVPRDRLLRIGFGALVFDTTFTDPVTKQVVRREVALSTTHQFRLPKGLK